MVSSRGPRYFSFTISYSMPSSLSAFWTRQQGVDEPAVGRAAHRLRRFLAERPRTQKEIEQARLWLTGVGHWVNLVRVPPSGTWERRRADLYGLAEEWVGAEPELNEIEAR